MKSAAQLSPVAQYETHIAASELDKVNKLPENVRKFFKLLDEHKFFSSKYFPGQKRMVIEWVHKLYLENPTLPVKQVVIAILTDLPDFLPSWNVRNVVGFITEEWKTLSKADEAVEVPAL